MGKCVSLPSFGGYSEQSLQSNHCFECAVYASQGPRDTMEDRNVVCLTLPKHPSHSLIGVFDGFNGADASTFMSENIVNTLDAIRDIEDDDAIIQAINQMDDDWLHHKHKNQDEPSSNINSGCTYVLALIKTGNRSVSSIELAHSAYSPHTMVTPRLEASSVQTISLESRSEPFVAMEEKGYKVRIFWAGDSRAMLMSPEFQFQNLTTDHHCTVAHEADRIVKADGTITNDRIDGICEVTRAFGCYPMKNNDSLPSNKQKMIVDGADTSLFCSHGDTLLLFCDGVYNKWSDERFQKVYKHHHLQQEDEKKGLLYASKYVGEQAHDEGSKDNITIIAVKF